MFEDHNPSGTHVLLGPIIPTVSAIERGGGLSVCAFSQNLYQFVRNVNNGKRPITITHINTGRHVVAPPHVVKHSPTPTPLPTARCATNKVSRLAGECNQQRCENAGCRCPCPSLCLSFCLWVHATHHPHLVEFCMQPLLHPNPFGFSTCPL